MKPISRGRKPLKIKFSVPFAVQSGNCNALHLLATLGRRVLFVCSGGVNHQQ